MATIDDINKSISEMTEKELLSRLLEIRGQRRAPTKRHTKGKTTKKKAPPKELTPADARALLADLVKAGAIDASVLENL